MQSSDKNLYLADIKEDEVSGFHVTGSTGLPPRMSSLEVEQGLAWQQGLTLGSTYGSFGNSLYSSSDEAQVSSLIAMLACTALPSVCKTL